MKAYDLLVFDWEGTLNDSAAHMKDCITSAMGELGLSVRNLDDLPEYLGLDASSLFKLLCADQPADIQVLLVQKFRQHYFVRTREFSLFPEVKAELHRLHEAGYLLAIATGMSRSALDMALEQTNINSLITISRTADQTFNKPHPQMLIEIMDEMGVTPERTLMIGDTVSDMQLAKNAGTQVVAISHFHDIHSTLHEHAPILCIRSLVELREYLGS